MFRPKTLEIIVDDSEHVEIRRNGELVKGSGLAVVIRKLFSWFQHLITENQKQEPTTTADEDGTPRGFFGRSMKTPPSFTPPAPQLTPEQRLNSVRDRALLKVARGIPLSGEEEDALLFGEHLL